MIFCLLVPELWTYFIELISHVRTCVMYVLQRFSLHLSSKEKIKTSKYKVGKRYVRAHCGHVQLYLLIIVPCFSILKYVNNICTYLLIRQILAVRHSIVLEKWFEQKIPFCSHQCHWLIEWMYLRLQLCSLCLKKKFIWEIEMISILICICHYNRYFI